MKVDIICNLAEKKFKCTFQIFLCTSFNTNKKEEKLFKNKS